MTPQAVNGVLWAVSAPLRLLWAYIEPILLTVVVPVAVVAFVVASIGAGLFWVSKGAGQYGLVEGYVGTIGMGKTTLAVQHVLRLAKMRGAVLMSNLPLVCGPKCADGVHEVEHELLAVGDDGLDLGRLMARASALRDEGRGLVLLVDEVGVVMPARLWKDFPVGLMWVLQQSRKLATEWVWTAQDETFVDSQLRRLTSIVWHVRSTPPPSMWRRAHGRRPWVLMATGFVPRSAGEPSKRVARKLFRYRRAWERSFDTDAVVLPSRRMKGAEVLYQALQSSGLGKVVWGDDSGVGQAAVAGADDAEGEGC